MPFLNLASTPTAGNDEVLATLKFLSRGPAEASGNGVSLRRCTLYLQQNGHYGLHAGGNLAVLEAQVQTVLTNLIGVGYVTTTPAAVGLGEEATTGYKLTRAGVLPSRRAKPYGLLTTHGS